jgi:hypothetical protein
MKKNNIPLHLRNLTKNRGYELNKSRYVKYNPKERLGLEILTKKHEERFLISSGFLKCESLIIHFPKQKIGLMTHHFPDFKKNYDSELKKILENISEKSNLPKTYSEFTLFQQNPQDYKKTSSLLKTYFPNTNPSEYQKYLNFIEIDMNSIIYFDSLTGKIEKTINPILAAE